ncbi:MAG: tRNA-dihydrouridine synthase family protein [Firmicutes bacterium]|nr:tRNA-dihydrouridine synthase family protein [Bacillota bacterium]
MRYFFAPMEGLTDSVYRRLHHRYFGGADGYYMPFLSPTVHRSLTAREERELPMAEGSGFTAIPQVLTKVPEDFLWAAERCRDRGYGEINLNLGCPSGTVTAKGKGAGMLADPEALERFLEAVFSRTVLPVSVKTRLGMAEPEEFLRLLEIFNRYPIRLLIVHPRVRKQFYGGSVNREMFRYAVNNSKNPLCYNGDLRSMADISELSGQLPQVDAVMLGRGLIADPGMLLPGGTDIKTLEAFYDALLEAYLSLLGGSRNAMFRLKEHWSYLIDRFEDSEKLSKRLRKTTDLAEYRSLAAEIFHTRNRT